MNDELKAMNAVSRAVDRVHRNGRFGTLELSNGIVLKIKPIPPLFMSAVVSEFKSPDIPKVYIAEDDRWEENPNDPNYLKEMTEIILAQNLAINDMAMAMGTEIISVPDGYYLPDEDAWIDQVKFAASITGVELNIDKDDKIKRYICWLRFYALETGADASLATGLPMELAGVREEEVDEAIESFRSASKRRTNTDLSLESGSQNGYIPNRSDRRSRTRDRGA